jgi:hypothetical protein
MKKTKSLILCLLVFTLSLSTVVSYALENNKVIASKQSNIQPESDSIVMPQYASFSGTIKKITPSATEAGSYMLYTVNEEGLEANIILSKDTFIVDNVKFKEGDNITIFYDATRPMILIYPPQYSAEVAVLTPKDQFVKYDLFDNDLVSSDGTLKLLISDDTKVVLKDGSVYKGKLKNQRLVVFYTISTKSIPAQTHPDKIIVVSKDSMGEANENSENENSSHVGLIQILLKLLGIEIKNR